MVLALAGILELIKKYLIEFGRIKKLHKKTGLEYISSPAMAQIVILNVLKTTIVDLRGCYRLEHFEPITFLPFRTTLALNMRPFELYTLQLSSSILQKTMELPQKCVIVFFLARFLNCLADPTNLYLSVFIFHLVISIHHSVFKRIYTSPPSVPV